MFKINKKFTLRNLIYIIALAGALLHFLNAALGIFPPMQFRFLHLLVIMTLAFLIEIKDTDNLIYRGFYSLFLILSFISLGYLILNFEWIAKKAGIITPEIVILGSVLILMVLIMTSKVLGFVLPTVVGVFLLYIFFGEMLPPPLGHSGLSFGRIINFLYTTSNGIFGIPIAVSARYLVLFLIMSEFLSNSGLDKLFIAIAHIVANKTRGGAAKASVVASALFGTISGTPIANVMVTGSFTIPMMKKSGFPANWAAAVEAAASTGGLIMPPIMGAGAFIMSDMLGVGYPAIMTAAVIPALLYFFSLFICLDFFSIINSKKLKIVESSKIIDDVKEIKNYLHSAIPLILFLIIVLLGYSVFRAAVVTIAIIPVFSWLKRETRMDLKDILSSFSKGMIKCVKLGAATASAGIIVGVIAQSGLGFSFVDMINLITGFPLLVLVVTALLCIIIGMGMPAVAAYVVVVTLVAPVFQNMGFIPIASHFFVFFFSCFASITPPVALGTYSAASLADADIWSSGIKGFTLASVGFVIPFMFIFSNELLGQFSNIVDLLIVLPIALFGVIIFESGIMGYLYFVGRISNVVLRVLLVTSGSLLIIPGIFTDFLSLALLIVVVFLEKFVIKSSVSIKSVEKK